jgi:excisionase family DNA binding protein
MGADLLSSGEVAEMLGVTARQVQRLAQKGQLPFVVKMPGESGAYLFERGVVEEMVGDD